jgi:L-asparaginase
MPRVRVFNVAATLHSQGLDSLDLAHYGMDYSKKPALTPAQLIERVPEMSRFAQMEPDLDWANISPRPEPQVLWPELAGRIQEVLVGDAGADGAIVVHGTNVLEETAYMLHLTLKTNKPVAVVGAQRPITALSSDGPMNLVNAVRVVVSPDSRDRGVMVVMNDQIHSARTVTKTSTYRLETFQSPALGPMGFADADKVTFYFRPERVHTVGTPFYPENTARMPRVDILYDYYGSDGGLVLAAMALGTKGIVVSGAGAGATSGMTAALKRAVAEGVVVVRSSRVGSGRVLPDDNFAFPGCVAADNLNAQKARVLLQLALTVTNDPSRIQSYFEMM